MCWYILKYIKKSDEKRQPYIILFILNKNEKNKKIYDKIYLHSKLNM